MVTVVPARLVIVVPAGIPAPVTVCPTTSPARLATPVMVFVPVADVPVNEVVIAAMVVPAGIPGPATFCPTARPTTLETFDTRVLPLDVLPVNDVVAKLVAPLNVNDV